MDHVQIENLRLVDATVDLLIYRHDEGVAVEVLRRRGEIEILKTLRSASLARFGVLRGTRHNWTWVQGHATRRPARTVQ